MLRHVPHVLVLTHVLSESPCGAPRLELPCSPGRPLSLWAHSPPWCRLITPQAVGWSVPRRLLTPVDLFPLLHEAPRTQDSGTVWAFPWVPAALLGLENAHWGFSFRNGYCVDHADTLTSTTADQRGFLLVPSSLRLRAQP